MSPATKRWLFAAAIPIPLAAPALASCGSTVPAKPSAASTPSPAASAPYKPDPAAVKAFLQTVHDMANGHPGEHPRLMAGKLSDSELLAAGLETCVPDRWLSLQTRPLVQKGWTQLDANAIAISAEWAELCPVPNPSPST